MNYLKVITDTETPAIIIEPGKPKFITLLIHGYGGSKEEMLPLGYRLALAGISALLIDLPGHGQNKELFNYQNAITVIEMILTGGYVPKAIVGHSIGARLGLTFKLPVVSISPPLTIYFEQERTELLKILRARRVKEDKPYSGLQTVLTKLNGIYGNDNRTLTLYGGRDLKTVKDFAKRQRNLGFATKMIKSAGHLDIISAEDSLKLVPRWLKKNVVSYG